VQPAELVAALLPHVDESLIALDFDGTLAPIVIDPMSSRPAPGALDALAALSRRGARVAVITGRDARTVLQLGRLDAVPGIIVAGLYGAESWASGEFDTLPTPDSMAALRQRLPALIEQHTSDEAVWVEDKRLSLVVHARGAADPATALESVRPAVEELAAELGVEVHAGRGILELRLPGYDKGGVLRRLATEHDPAAVLFAGDDLGDLPAFHTVRELRAEGRPAWSVAAGSADVPEVAAAADVRVDGPEGVVELLRGLAGG
jgi:trehalose 6-phosphate phosphatase